VHHFRGFFFQIPQVVALARILGINLTTFKFFFFRYGDFFIKSSPKAICWIRQPFFFLGRRVAKIRHKKKEKKKKKKKHGPASPAWSMRE
jgi:hypothetical protein